MGIEIVKAREAEFKAAVRALLAAKPKTKENPTPSKVKKEPGSDVTALTTTV